MTDHDVTDYDPRVKEMLETQVPLRLDAEADWAGALRKAEGAPDSGRLTKWGLRMRNRRLLAPVLAVVVLGIAGAPAAGVHWWSGPPTPIDTTKATKLVEYTLIASTGAYIKGDTIALWRLPQPDGSVCVYQALASPRPTAPLTDAPNPALGGGFCSLSDGGEPQVGKPIRVVTLEGGRPPAGLGWVIDGTVSSDSGIARLEIQSDAGSFPLGYSHGWFLGQLPGSSSTSDLPRRDLAQRGQYVVVGYDSKGKAVERLDLRQAFRISAPSGT